MSSPVEDDEIKKDLEIALETIQAKDEMIESLRIENDELREKIKTLETKLKREGIRRTRSRGFTTDELAHSDFSAREDNGASMVPRMGRLHSKTSAGMTIEEMAMVVIEEKSEEVKKSSNSKEDEFQKQIYDDLKMVETLPNHVLKLGPDSPHMRKDIIAKEKLVGHLETHLQVVSKLGFELCDCSREYSRILSELAKEFSRGWTDVDVQEETGSPLSLDKSFRQLGNLLMEIENIQGLFTHSFENAFASPLRHISESCGKSIRRQSSLVEKAREAYESLLMKYLSVKPHRGTPENSTNQSFRGELITDLSEKIRLAHERLDGLRFEHIEKLNEVLVLKKMDIIEHMCSCFYTFNSFFHAGQDLYVDTEQDAKRLQILLGKRRETFSIANKQARSKRALVTEKTNTSPIVETKENVLPMSQAPILEKQGFLLKLSSGLKRDWKRRWFTLDRGNLEYYRQWNDLTPIPVVNILLCSIRILEDYDRKFCFEIISPTTRNYILQAESETDLYSWVDAIRSCTEHMLQNSEDAKIGLVQSKKQDSEILVEGQFVAQDFVKSNPICSDCGAPDPEWCSINLGIALCLDCSGVHRSMGVGVSKVRSLKMDALEAATLAVLSKIGNQKANAIWAAKIESSTKIHPKISSLSRGSHIKSKYIDRKFVDLEKLLKVIPQDRENEVIEKAVASGDIETLICVAALGLKFKTVQIRGKSLLHISCEKDDVSMVEYLCNHGLKILEKDSEGKTSIDIASQSNSNEVLKLLQKKITSGEQ